jgi:hypothetical protein
MRPTCLLACAVFVLMLLFSLWRNDFPARYHPDEPEKVAQVLSGDRNFRHPPLMLDVVSLVLHLVSGPARATPQGVVQMGRCISAIYMAGACATLTWLAGFYGGTLAAAFAAVLLAGNTHAVLAGHFLKEDPLFALGLSLVLLAGAYRWKDFPSRFSVLALGAAAGFAMATKYLGVVAFFYAVAMEIALPRTGDSVRRLPRRLLTVFLTAFVVLLFFSSASWWNHFPAMSGALFDAGQTAYRGNYGIGAKVPHAHYLGMFFLEPPLALVGVALCGWTFARETRSGGQSMDRWLLFAAPFALLLVFSFSAITAVRYFLPISLLLACLGGCGLAAGTKILRGAARRRWALPPNATTASALAICALTQLPALIFLERGFASDDHLLVRSYIATNLPANAVIAADQLASVDALQLPQRVLTRDAIADLGAIDTLCARGITHVVVCWYDSRRYVTPSKHPDAGAESDFFRRREFYLGLKNHTRLLWHSDLAQPFPLHPGLSLYQLPP